MSCQNQPLEITPTLHPRYLHWHEPQKCSLLETWSWVSTGICLWDLGRIERDPHLEQAPRPSETLQAVHDHQFPRAVLGLAEGSCSMEPFYPFHIGCSSFPILHTFSKIRAVILAVHSARQSEIFHPLNCCSFLFLAFLKIQLIIFRHSSYLVVSFLKTMTVLFFTYIHCVCACV